MFRRGGLIVSGLILSTLLAFADIADTVIPINQVVAKGVKFGHYAIGAKILSIDSAILKNYSMNSLADLLSQNSVVNITSYGPGGQAGIKMRGGGADHTTIIWNGLNIKPPMSGELNASSINSGMFDHIQIQPGGSSTMYGTGAATGVVYLSNKLKLDNSGLGGVLNFEAGSFDTYGGLASGGYSGMHFSTRVNLSYQESANNFEFVNNQRFGKPKEIQQHAAYATLSVGQQNAIKFGQRTKIESDLWYSNHFKQIPSLISDPEPGKAEQNDNNFNFALNFSHFGSNWFIKYRGGMLAYKQDYLGYDTAYYNVINRSNSFINEVETKYSLSEFHQFYLGINNTIDKAFSDSYTKDAFRNQWALYARYKLSLLKDKLNLNFDARQSLVDAEFLPLVYSGGLNLEIVSGLFLKALGSKNYALPDLNDLYWARSAFAEGNPDLKPEYGWSSEAAIMYHFARGKVNTNHEITVYRSELTNAIIWLDVGENNRWIPDNYDGAITKGLEFSGTTKMEFNHLAISIGYDYTYTQARMNDSDNGVDADEQRRYIPEHKAGVRLIGTYKNLSTILTGHYVGERNIDKVTQALEAYQLFDVSVNYRFSLGETELSAYLKVKNITNIQYQIMAGYVQPPRGIYCGLNYKF